MRRTSIVILSAALMSGVFASIAHAQIMAGSPEDKAYRAVLSASDAETKDALLADFEKNFPQSKALAALYDNLISAYRAKNNPAKIIEFGEKALKLDSEDLVALLALAENYGRERRDVEKAVTYAKKALDVITGMQKQPTPTRMKEADWKEWLNTSHAHADSLLKWAQSL